MAPSTREPHDAPRASDPQALRVAVLGAGVMGAPIAAEFLAAGHQVRITTSGATSEQQARDRTLVWLLPDSGLDAQLEWCASTVEACAGADLVIESLPESLPFKQTHLRDAQGASPTAILATNTSSLSVAAIAVGLEDPSRLVGLHYLNPPPAFRVVELVTAEATDDAVVADLMAILTRFGKEPVRVRDVPGFAINRLQFALLREAEHLVAADVVSREDVDRLVRDGLALRWSIAGPFATAELGNAALFASVASRIYPELATFDAPTPVLSRTTLSAAALQRLAEHREQRLACRPIPAARSAPARVDGRGREGS